MAPWLGLALAALAFSTLHPELAWATGDAVDIEATPMGSKGGYAVDMLWTVIAAVLVFWMQAGFGLLEAGFTRAKNAVNIMMKNLMDFSVGSIAFWAVGFALMFGKSNGFFGTTGFFLAEYADDVATYSFFFFQTVFCATAATIVSGAMAERTRFSAYMVTSAIMTALIYPMFGSWAWGGLFAGGGWLEAPAGGVLDRLGLPPFIDFAGSTVVHSLGGWAALAGAIALGPRIGKFDKNGESRPILGHSLVLATAGCFILWMGWFGFNAGSTTSVAGGADNLFGGAGKAMALIAVNTNLAAAGGGLVATLISWRLNGKPDLGIAINGTLGGLVAITAGCATMRPHWALVTGAVAGAVVFASIILLERRGVDDPVGAVSVHAVGGAWGTLAVALFHHAGPSAAQLASQALGVGTCFLWSFGIATVFFKLQNAAGGLRVSAAEELEGLDLSEHALEAYPADYAFGVSHENSEA